MELSVKLILSDAVGTCNMCNLLLNFIQNFKKTISFMQCFTFKKVAKHAWLINKKDASFLGTGKRGTSH